MKLSFALTKFGFVLLLLIPLGLSCSSGSSDGGGDDDDDDDDDDTPSSRQCEDACEHIYDECEFILVGADGDDLSQDECEETCPEQTTTLVDCLEDVACTDAAINACLEDSDDGDECEDDNDCNTGEVCTNGACVTEDECDSDFDCAADEECTAGTCVATESNLCGGQACATGCCQGSVCCGGVFCAGDCIGTPCCD